MADEKGQPGYSAQPETTQYQSTGRTAAPLRAGTVGSINGYTRAPGLAKPSVFDFNFKTNVCPNCQGTGRVPKARDEELVAIIPYNDKRLKRPKRYCCYLSVCLLLLMAGGAVCTGLLFPRAVTVQQYKYSSGFWTVNNGTSLGSTKDLQITMPIQVQIHLKNNNFVGVSINTISVSVIHDMILVGSFNRTQSFTLPPRSDVEHTANVTCIFKGKEATRVKTLCSATQFENTLFFTVQVSSVYTNIAQSFETDYTTRASLLCNLGSNTILSET